MNKKVPIRKCVVCGERFEKSKLLRVVLDDESLPMPDPTGKKNGRGAYLCFSENCKKNIKTIECVVRNLHGIADTDRSQEILDYINSHSTQGVEGNEKKSV